MYKSDERDSRFEINFCASLKNNQVLLKKKEDCFYSSNMNHVFFISEFDFKILKGIEQLKLKLQHNTSFEEGIVAFCLGRG